MSRAIIAKCTTAFDGFSAYWLFLGLVVSYIALQLLTVPFD